jgi:hypothetical protein
LHSHIRGNARFTRVLGKGKKILDESKKCKRKKEKGDIPRISQVGKYLG